MSIYDRLRTGELCPHCLTRQKSKQGILCLNCAHRIVRLEKLGLIERYKEYIRSAFLVIKGE